VKTESYLDAICSSFGAMRIKQTKLVPHAAVMGAAAVRMFIPG